MFYRISKNLFFTDGGLSDYLPGPIKDLDQTGPLTAGKANSLSPRININIEKINIFASRKQDLVPVEICMDLLLLN